MLLPNMPLCNPFTSKDEMT
uniref:Uncharacterized protein n=1 Tax=Nymphaea colorata TaxID=210225 RepID=A0A5K0ZKX8_9MAGN